MSIRRVAAAVTAALAIVAASGSPTAALASAIPAGTPSVTELSNPSAHPDIAGLPFVALSRRQNAPADERDVVTPTRA